MLVRVDRKPMIRDASGSMGTRDLQNARDSHPNLKESIHDDDMILFCGGTASRMCAYS